MSHKKIHQYITYATKTTIMMFSVLIAKSPIKYYECFTKISCTLSIFSPVCQYIVIYMYIYTNCCPSSRRDLSRWNRNAKTYCSVSDRKASPKLYKMVIYNKTIPPTKHSFHMPCDVICFSC